MLRREMASGSPLFDVMCLLARTQLGPQEAERIHEIVGVREFDWSAFVPFVGRHYVVPLVQRNLAALGAEVAPKEVLEVLRVRARLNAWKAQHFATELVRLFRLFESHGIETIHYKGAVAAEQYYGAVTLRTFGDLDFLLRRSDVTAMVRLLESEGYVNSNELTPRQFEHFVAEHKEFLFKRGDFQLEPHWSLTLRRYPFDVPYEALWQRAGTLRLNSSDVRVLGAEDSVLVSCLVGAKGRWKRMQMVSDVAACVRSLPHVDWTTVVRRARESGTYRILLLGIRLAADLGGAPTPTVLVDDVRTPVVGRLARDVVRSLIAAPRERRFLPGGPGVFSPLLFRQRERVADRWRYLWLTTTTPSTVHMERMPLPAPLFPLYRILVPLHDYVAIPATRLLGRNV